MEAEVWAQHPGYTVHVDQPWPRDTYARYLTEQWALPCDLVVVEGDVLPPPGAIQALIDCEHEWCLHRLWLEDHYADISLGLCKFSAGLKARLPFAPARAWWGEHSRIIVTNWKAIDIALAYELTKNKTTAHIHEPPPIHLRYANDPQGLR